jgi:hypothetical protein
MHYININAGIYMSIHGINKNLLFKKFMEGESTPKTIFVLIK